MMAHTFDPEDADKLEDPARYRYLSRDELLAAIRPRKRKKVIELGSGTGFYTDDVAPYVRRLVAVDSQERMHDYYRDKGVPDNVVLIHAAVETMPFETRQFDAAFSTMTFHEFVSRKALQKVEQVVRPGGVFVVADWSAEGEGDAGPGLSERYSASEAAMKLDNAGFEVQRSRERMETFFVVARKPD
ncbi:MAG: class I SAM-dependent methyltransferase [Candidatus Nanohaloarchaea archaeon]|nr:class I SAM-dependent methyltransferase [Candidatus Nanohaloarchaea archaeon]